MTRGSGRRRVSFRRGAAALALFFVSGTPRFTAALPSLGSPRPNVALEDAWERKNELARYPGVPLLVVYEDEHSVTQNLLFKRQLAELGRVERYRKAIALFAVADVSGYDYWPVRGFVRGSIRAESEKQGTTIYCDWNGHVRQALGLDRGVSNVVLYGRNGDVLFAHAGPMSDAERSTIIGLLRAQADR